MDSDQAVRTTSHVTTTSTYVKTIWEQQTFSNGHLLTFVDVYDHTKAPTLKAATQCCSGKNVFIILVKLLKNNCQGVRKDAG